MATRTTIQLQNTFGEGTFNQTVTLYKHWDGYPSNVKPLIELAVVNANVNPKDRRFTSNVLAELIKLDDKIEITKSHELHGDTEYQYNLKGKNLEIMKYDFDSNQYLHEQEYKIS
tara:strand:+ start:64 stop:408 length:345 start_codon:yes stop_codon:yes gene_type:complete